MKIVLISIGTRGDMEPFLAITKLLQEKGHHITCAFPSQFSSQTESMGLQFYSLGPEFLAVLDSKKGKAVLGGNVSGLKKLLVNI